MYRVIPNNHISTKLSHGQELLKPYIEQNPSRPLQINKLKASILFNNQPIPKDVELANSSNQYKAIIKGASVWLDTYAGAKSLVLLLDSPDLMARHQYLIETYGLQSMYSEYTPHVTLEYNVVENHPKYRWFYNEIIDTFNGRLKGEPLTFSGEILTQSSLYVKDQPTLDSGTANSDARNSGSIVQLN